MTSMLEHSMFFSKHVSISSCLRERESLIVSVTALDSSFFLSSPP
jgi:hypothetical protein